MEPLLRNQDTLLVSNLPYLFKKPKINDIVVFEYKKGNMMIKRIIGIRNNKFFVTGDNKKDSLDSRSFGEISKNRILGKVIYKF